VTRGSTLALGAMALGGLVVALLSVGERVARTRGH
jgi:hypothetical protein